MQRLMWRFLSILRPLEAGLLGYTNAVFLLLLAKIFWAEPVPSLCSRNSLQGSYSVIASTLAATGTCFQERLRRIIRHLKVGLHGAKNAVFLLLMTALFYCRGHCPAAYRAQYPNTKASLGRSAEGTSSSMQLSMHAAQHLSPTDITCSMTYQQVAAQAASAPCGYFVCCLGHAAS